MIMKIKDICSTVYSGGTPNKKHPEYYEGGEIPWLNTGEIAFNRIYKTEKYISDIGFSSSSAKWVPANAVIVAMYGATAARTAITKIPLTTNQACCNLVIDEDKADYRYVYYYLCSQYTQLASLANGGAQQNLNAGQIKDYDIDLPDMATQRKVADLLTMLDDKIEVNNEINKNLEEQARLLYHSWFIDYEPFGGSAPSDWQSTSLGKIATMKTDSWSPAKNPDVVVEHYSIPAFDEKRYPVFEIAAGIKSNKYILTQESIMISKLNPDTKRIWRPLCLSGHPVCSTEFIIYEAKKDGQRDFIYSILDSTLFYNHLCSHTTGSTNSRQRAMPKTTLDFPVLLPPDEIIADFCSIVTPMHDLIALNTIEGQSLAKTRDSLLPRLMSGELEVSDLDL